jgi:cytochrome P450
VPALRRRPKRPIAFDGYDWHQSIASEVIVTDPKDPLSAVTHADPYPFYRRLRLERPIYDDHDLDLWVASSAEMVMAVLSEPAFQVRPPAEPIPMALRSTSLEPIFSSLVRMTDGSCHQHMKQAVMTALSGVEPARLGHMAHRVSVMLDLASPVDLKSRLRDAMYRLPVFVIAQLLGMRIADLAPAAEATAKFVTAIASGATVSQIDAGCAAVTDLLAMLSNANTDRPHGLCKDLLNEALPARQNRQQALANALGLLSQTFDATAGLVGNGFLALARLRNDAGLVERGEAGWIAYLTEVLRYDPPVQNTRRFTCRDIELGGVSIPAGATILLVLAAANRDPQLNADPDEFRCDRLTPRMLTFGHDAHCCPGQAIALTIAAAALSMLWPIWADHREIEDMTDGITYRPLPNVRIPEVTI